jgi:hypothetical protein
MKRKLILLLALFAGTAIFTWSHYYYADKHIELRDKVTVMEYKVLDKQVWSLDGQAKEAALATDTSYQDIAQLKKASKGALQRSQIGKWIAILGALASIVYLVYFLWFAVYVELIRNKGYETIAEGAKNLAEKVGDTMESTSELPREEDRYKRDA